MPRVSDVSLTESIAVSNTILRVLGASTWTGASRRTPGTTAIRLTNQSRSLYAYIKLVRKDAAITGVVASDNNDENIPPRGSTTVRVSENMDIAVVRESTSTDKVTATELKEIG